MWRHVEHNEHKEDEYTEHYPGHISFAILGGRGTTWSEEKINWDKDTWINTSRLPLFGRIERLKRKEDKKRYKRKTSDGGNIETTIEERPGEWEEAYVVEVMYCLGTNRTKPTGPTHLIHKKVNTFDEAITLANRYLGISNYSKDSKIDKEL